MRFIVIIICLILVSCKKKPEEILPAPVYQIEKAFQPFMKTFLAEAQARNVKIDTTNLIIRAATATNSLDEVCGTCKQNAKKTNEQKIIEIATEIKLCWGDLTNNAKEELVFHELGHCLLNRIAHKNDLFADQTPKSIMYKNISGLYAPCVYDISGNNDCNKTNRRKYYVDELFDPKASSPTWAK